MTNVFSALGDDENGGIFVSVLNLKPPIRDSKMGLEAMANAPKFVDFVGFSESSPC
jgi:hypothetical protein